MYEARGGCRSSKVKVVQIIVKHNKTFNEQLNYIFTIIMGSFADNLFHFPINYLKLTHRTRIVDNFFHLSINFVKLT